MRRVRWKTGLSGFLITKMIFFLNETVAALSGIPKNVAEELFTELLRASRKGWHMLVADRDCYRWAKKELGLSELSKSHIDDLLQSHATTAGIIDIAVTYLEIKAGASPIQMTANHFTIGHEVFLSGNFYSQETSFVVENSINDNEFYKFMFELVMEESSVPYFKYHPVNGGGSSTNQLFKTQIDDKKVVVCLTDTDQLSPSGQRSSTCKLAVRVQNGNQGAFVGQLFTTVGREIENFIPLSILLDMDCYQNKVVPDEIKTAVDDTMDSDEPFWHFFDIKKGLNASQISQKKNDGRLSEDTVNWIRAQFSCVDEAYNNLEFEGFGSNTLKNFMGCDKSKNAFRSFLKSSGWGEVYRDFFRKILWYFCSTIAVRV